MNSPEEIRVELSAVKARGYFEDSGCRGLLITRPASNDHPFSLWLPSDVLEAGRVYENRYVVLDRLKELDCPADVLFLVETYNPATEAVVSIEFAPGDRRFFEPRVVRLPTFMQTH